MDRRVEAAAMLTRPAVTPDTLLLLEGGGELGELGGGDDIGHLVDVAPAIPHGHHHPVDVVHQLRAVRVEGDVGGVGRHPRPHR